MMTPKQVEASLLRIVEYSKPYQAKMARAEQRDSLEVMLLGMASELERKSVEPIAVHFGRPPRALQGFVGISKWDHSPLRELQWKEVDDEIGIEEGHLIVDGSGVPKKGNATVGVKRQYCGRLGKVDNCVIGVHAVYVGKDGQAVLVNSDLFLPEDWLASEKRALTHVPPEVIYRTQPDIALEQIRLLSKHLRFKWVHGDDEFGRYRELRDEARALGCFYTLDVPCDTQVALPPRAGSPGQPVQTVKNLADSVRPRAWKAFVARGGEKGPIRVRAWSTFVRTARDDGIPATERLLVIETPEGTERRYYLCHAPKDIGLTTLVRHALIRHRIEEVFEEAKGEVGMDHFEIRSYHGWHHHMTLTQTAHWFFVREQRILGKRTPGITVSMIRAVVGKLLAPPTTPQMLANLVNYWSGRNEAARKARYAAQGLDAPPRRFERGYVVT